MPTKNIVASSFSEVRAAKRGKQEPSDAAASSMIRALAAAEEESRRWRLEAQEQRDKAERALDVIAVARMFVAWASRIDDAEPKIREFRSAFTEALKPVRGDVEMTELEAKEAAEAAA
jgi:hypothetical protein